MEGLNQGFKIATKTFEKIINPTKKILKKVDKILEILLDSHQNIVIMTSASTVSILLILGLTLTTNMMKIAINLKQKEEDANKLVKELYEKWDKMEISISGLVQKINQVRKKSQPAAIEYVPVPMENCNFHRGLPNSMSLCQTQISESMAIK